MPRTSNQLYFSNAKPECGTAQAALAHHVEYVRTEKLPALLGMWPHEVEARDLETTRTIVRRLRCALRAERQRGMAGRWAYDLNRHMCLIAALKQESALLSVLEKSAALRPDPDLIDSCKSGLDLEIEPFSSENRVTPPGQARSHAFRERL